MDRQEEEKGQNRCGMFQLVELGKNQLEYLKGRYRLQQAFVYYFDCAQKFIFKLVEIATIRVGLNF